MTTFTAILYCANFAEYSGGDCIESGDSDCQVFISDNPDQLVMNVAGELSIGDGYRYDLTILIDGMNYRNGNIDVHCTTYCNDGTKYELAQRLYADCKIAAKTIREGRLRKAAEAKKRAAANAAAAETAKTVAAEIELLRTLQAKYPDVQKD